jgi:long-subunit fatty acid transport protein
MLRKRLLTIITLSLGLGQAFAQFPEDALRLSTPGFGVGARAMGMGNAYTGVASDFSAIYFNPAGLAQLTRGEFSMGMSYLNAQDDSERHQQRHELQLVRNRPPRSCSPGESCPCLRLSTPGKFHVRPGL